MSAIYNFLLAGFKAPLEVSNGVESLIWLLPLSLTISIIYKVINLEKITTVKFIKQVAVSFISIVVVVALAILGLHIFDMVVLR